MARIRFDSRIAPECFRVWVRGTAGTVETDLYQLTMAAGYFHRGMAGLTATCELFVRRLPETRRFLVGMGVDAAQRSLPLRLGQEVQAVPRQAGLSVAKLTLL